MQNILPGGSALIYFTSLLDIRVVFKFLLKMD